VTEVRTSVLRLPPEELVACVACGLCLPHCPTYRVTGFEIASPRGRIAAMRAVDLEGAPVDDAFRRAMDECIQCRGCEAACPSSVPFGHLMEGTRAALHEDHVAGESTPRRLVEWVAYRLLLPHHRLLLAFTWLLLVAQRLRLVPRRFGLPHLDAHRLRTPLMARAPGSGDAYLFPGCVMDAWDRPVHDDVLAVMRAAGAQPMLPGRGADCCGALHAHAGRADDARRLARRVIASMPGDAPIVVDSAGCGAAMKDYGRLLGSADARAFSARVQDFSEWLAAQSRIPTGAAAGDERARPSIVVQDPCHLRHVQKAHLAVRTVLAKYYGILETSDDGLCCGAGGAYSALEPELATAVRARKVDAIRAAGGPHPVVASANPGCTMHLRAVGLDVRHPATLIREALHATEEG
jgi:glycolate oxidase iron-sulfur subunit